MPDLPPDLLQAFKDRRVAIFVGAGASRAAGAPTWSHLIGLLASELGIRPDANDGTFSTRMLMAVPQYYVNASGTRGPLLNKVASALKVRHDSQVHDLLANLPCDLYYTTNFDRLLERAFNRAGKEFTLIDSEEKARRHAQRRGCQIRKLHGDIEGEIVITREDFAQFLDKNPTNVDILTIDLMTMCFLFVGYSLSDPDFNSVFDHTFFKMRPVNQKHFIVLPTVNPHESSDLNKRGIQTLTLSDWPGNSLDDRLTNFLMDLCEKTSDALHVARVFSNLSEGRSVPIVIPAVMHQAERYFYWPTMDYHASKAISRALALKNIEGFTHSDRDVIPEGSYKSSVPLPASSDVNEFLAQDVILIGSPRGNLLTKYFFEHGPQQAVNRHMCPITVQFQQSERSAVQRSLRDTARSTVLTANDPGRVNLKEGQSQCDYALIARYPNPWARGRTIYVMAGIWGMGTQAIGDLFQDTMNCGLIWRALSAIREHRRASAREVRSNEPDILILEVRYRTSRALPHQYDDIRFMDWRDGGLVAIPGLEPLRNPQQSDPGSTNRRANGGTSPETNL